MSRPYRWHAVVCPRGAPFVRRRSCSFTLEQMTRGREGPRQRAECNREVRDKALEALNDARETWERIVSIPDEKWAENFTTTKDEMLKSVGKRIKALEKK